MQEFITILVLAVLGFVGFVVYFIFKQLQFVIQAINLYKKMITRQDVMIKLLKDIRGKDGKDYEEDDDEISNEEESSKIGTKGKVKCTKCGKEIEIGEGADSISYCYHCGNPITL